MLLQFLQVLFLGTIVTNQILSIFVLFVKDSVFCLNNVHLHHRSNCVFLSRRDGDLLSMVLYLSYHVVKHMLKVVQVTTHCHLVFIFVTTKKNVILTKHTVHCLN